MVYKHLSRRWNTGDCVVYSHSIVQVRNDSFIHDIYAVAMSSFYGNGRCGLLIQHALTVDRVVNEGCNHRASCGSGSISSGLISRFDGEILLLILVDAYGILLKCWKNFIGWFFDENVGSPFANELPSAFLSQLLHGCVYHGCLEQASNPHAHEAGGYF